MLLSIMAITTTPRSISWAGKGLIVGGYKTETCPRPHGCNSNCQIGHQESVCADTLVPPDIDRLRYRRYERNVLLPQGLFSRVA